MDWSNCHSTLDSYEVALLAYASLWETNPLRRRHYASVYPFARLSSKLSQLLPRRTRANCMRSRRGHTVEHIKGTPEQLLNGLQKSMESITFALVKSSAFRFSRENNNVAFEKHSCFWRYGPEY